MKKIGMEYFGAFLSVIMMVLAGSTLASIWVYENIVNALWTASAILAAVTLPAYVVTKFVFMIEVDND